MLFGIKALFSQRNCVSLCIYVPQFLRVWERVCTGVLLPMCMHACMFIIQLIVYGGWFLWHNKLKLLNPFDADNAISQGYQEWVRDALGTSDLSDETSVLWVTVFLLWFLFCMDRLRQTQPRVMYNCVNCNAVTRVNDILTRDLLPGLNSSP